MEKAATMLNFLIETIKQSPDVLAVILFGSYATGKMKGISDIDIAVILETQSKDLEADIGSMYSPYIDVVLFHRLPLHVQFEVLKSGKVLFCKDERKLFEIKFKVLREYLEMSNTYERIKRMVLK